MIKIYKLQVKNPCVFDAIRYTKPCQGDRMRFLFKHFVNDYRFRFIFQAYFTDAFTFEGLFYLFVNLLADNDLVGFSYRLQAWRGVNAIADNRIIQSL